MALVWPCKLGTHHPIGRPLGGGQISFTFCQRELGLTPNGFLRGATRPNFVEPDGPNPLAPYAGALCIVIELGEAEAEAARKAEADPRWKPGFYSAEISPQTAEERINKHQQRPPASRDSV